MIQLLFLVFAAVGLCYTTNYLADDSLDTRTLLYGRLGALSFAVGVVGLITIAVQSC